jgi:drug/metabolite transporter (DMT)-like permease
VKLAIHDIPPLIQSTVRSITSDDPGCGMVWFRGISLFKRDGTLVAGVFAGVLFALEFLLIYRGLLYTTATRAVLFLYIAPFFVALGARWLVKGDYFHLMQSFGMAMSFAGIAIALGLPTPAADPHQMLGDLMMVAAAIAWAATTLVIKVSRLNQISVEKTLLYQLVVSVPLLAAGAVIFGEHIETTPSAVAIGALAYQAVWVVCVTYMAWFALIVRSASRLSSFYLPDAAVRCGRRPRGAQRAPPRPSPWRWRWSPSA